jgi:hypothetical protein
MSVLSAPYLTESWVESAPVRAETIFAERNEEGAG